MTHAGLLLGADFSVAAGVACGAGGAACASPEECGSSVRLQAEASKTHSPSARPNGVFMRIAQAVYHYPMLKPRFFRVNAKRRRDPCLPREGAILVPLMSGRFWASAILCSVFALLHCGGTVVTSVDDSGGGAGRGHAGRAGHAGRGNSIAGSGGNDPFPDAGFDAYVDPGCPDVGAPVEIRECDPFAIVSTCPVGQGCFPFVDHPFGAGCDAQSFGTACRPAGTGKQGDICGSGDQSCAAGFVCVVGSQPGKHCVQLCHIGEQKVCPAGMICGELDVEGYGVCS